jgi:hypothetical protein
VCRVKPSKEAPTLQRCESFDSASAQDLIRPPSSLPGLSRAQTATGTTAGRESRGTRNKPAASSQPRRARPFPKATHPSAGNLPKRAAPALPRACFTSPPSAVSLGAGWPSQDKSSPADQMCHAFARRCRPHAGEWPKRPSDLRGREQSSSRQKFQPCSESNSTWNIRRSTVP